MFEITGIWQGEDTTVSWDEGKVAAPNGFLELIAFLETNVTEGPVPVVFEYPDMKDREAAAQVIEFIFDKVDSTTGPAISWDDCLSGDFTKHYGPGPHKSGSPQSAHGRRGKGKEPAQTPPMEESGMSRSRKRNIEQAAKRIDEQYAENQAIVDATEHWDETFNDTTWLHSDREIYGEMFDYMDDDFWDGTKNVNGWDWLVENHPEVADMLEMESENDFMRRHIIRKYVRSRSRKAIGGWDEWGRKTTGKAIVKTREFLENSRQFIRIDGDDLERVLLGGQVFNQHAMGESNGWFNPDGRTRVEATLFGYEGQMRDSNEQSQYPIYGYYGDEPMVWNSGEAGQTFDEEGTAKWARNLEPYGATAIELKHGVAATFMLGDSLDDTGVPQYGRLDAVMPFAMPGDPSNPGIETIAFSGPRLSRTGKTIQDEVRYVEAQYHEPITFEDIKAIHVPASYVEELDMTGEEFHDTYLPDHIELVVHP